MHVCVSRYRVVEDVIQPARQFSPFQVEQDGAGLAEELSLNTGSNPLVQLLQLKSV